MGAQRPSSRLPCLSSPWRSRGRRARQRSSSSAARTPAGPCSGASAARPAPSCTSARARWAERPRAGAWLATRPRRPAGSPRTSGRRLPSCLWPPREPAAAACGRVSWTAQFSQRSLICQTGCVRTSVPRLKLWWELQHLLSWKMGQLCASLQQRAPRLSLPWRSQTQKMQTASSSCAASTPASPSTGGSESRRSHGTSTSGAKATVQRRAGAWLPHLARKVRANARTSGRRQQLCPRPARVTVGAACRRTQPWTIRCL
mmetsp:Transcript_52841/g.169213  ORF Transcript_52841/g.169213 Transcript_52841/m.169213 type:complete len:259 (+) Transcript_52841:829-1605(+)